MQGKEILEICLQCCACRWQRYTLVVASLVAEHGLWGASVVVACRLSCPLACGIFPDQGLNQCSLHWQADSLPLSHKESPGVTSCQEESSQTISSIPVTTLTTLLLAYLHSAFAGLLILLVWNFNILSSITFHISHLCAFKSLHEDTFLILFQEK